MMDTNKSDTSNHNCVSTTHLGNLESPAISAVMFSAGVLGNLIALVLLERRRRGNRGNISLFFILVTGLVITDLVGTCMISPVVLVSYAKRRTLINLNLCNYFAFAMTFFSLATMMVLFAMALERALAIGYPYFYEKFIKKSLIRMHKRQKSRRIGSLMNSKQERISMSEEIDHLILLSIMTIAFIVCSVPFTVRAYINRIDSEKGNDKMDLSALRYLSINSIIDPWIFTILRPSVLRLMRSALCCRNSPTMRSIRNSPSLSTRLSTSTKLNFVDTTYGISQKKQLADGDKIAWGDKTET
ncbi:prostaglandin E2 receptor EP2 subtype isoform X2 [Engystomops pustulosus]|uniref:prostaglandin E2 receptor EP2 subtype isoform X2 n=1 Tax=Engystomops pustulosus TaxID=76066 RepID=UPI003AFB6A50